MVSDHRIRTDTGRIPQHGGTPDDQKNPGRRPNSSWEYSPLGRLWGGGVERGIGVHHLESEHNRAIHCDAPKSGNIHGDREEYGVMSIKTVVKTGRDKPHRGAYGGVS